jgi:RpiR family glv operon transcriptional regulator
MRIQEMVYSNYNNLNETDLHIWKYVCENKKVCCTQSIDEMASRCNVSRTTITRFVKKIGLRGFSEFKVLLSWESNSDQYVEEGAFDIACDSITRYVEEQRKKDYSAICRMIYEAPRIFVYGTGDIQNSVARQIKRMFLSCQEIIYDFDGRTFDHAFFQLVKENDLVIIISLSGANQDALHIAEQLRIKGVHIISITEFQDNPLTRRSDESLYVSFANLSILNAHPFYKATMLYFLLAELLFIKYSIYKRHRMITEGLECNI